MKHYKVKESEEKENYRKEERINIKKEKGSSLLLYVN